ncbi:MAG: hypothetical protein ABW252_23625 [Polyangiales bacterium]
MNRRMKAAGALLFAQLAAGVAMAPAEAQSRSGWTVGYWGGPESFCYSPFEVSTPGGGRTREGAEANSLGDYGARVDFTDYRGQQVDEGELQDQLEVRLAIQCSKARNVDVDVIDVEGDWESGAHRLSCPDSHPYLAVYSQVEGRRPRFQVQCQVRAQR